MNRKPVCWADALKKLFGPGRKKRTQSRLGVEELQERVLPSTTYFPSATVGDPTVTPKNLTTLNSLRSDIILANEDLSPNAIETFDLTGGATYTLTQANPKTGSENLGFFGDLDLNNLHGKGTKTYIFVGLGTGATIDQTVLDRVFDSVGSNVIAEFRNVTITGGRAVDNGSIGALPGTTQSWGGGILNQGSEVILSDTHIVKDTALGLNGASGLNGQVANKKNEVPGFGGFGVSGSWGFGGGVYSTNGAIIVSNDSAITNDLAIGGQGGFGGAGGGVSGTATGNGATGSPGGNGGNAGGGGVFIANGTLTISTDGKVSTNEAQAGAGGAGGAGGFVKVKPATSGVEFFGGAGGQAGSGGTAEGGGIVVLNGSVTISLNSEVESNQAIGGMGGTGGAGGSGAKTGNVGAPGGVAGNGGGVTGGGIVVGTGNVTIESQSLVNDNVAAAGIGGAGGAGGNGFVSSGFGGSGGAGASANGGGIYDGSGNVVLEQQSSITGNKVLASVGGNGGNGGDGIGKLAVVDQGGNGGDAGDSFGGGIDSLTGTVTIEKTGSVLSNLAAGRGHHTGTSAGGTKSGSKPTGAAGGIGGNAHSKSEVAGIGGNGGSGFSAFGGGIYSGDGNVNIQTKSLVSHNQVRGGKGGSGGVGGSGSLTGDFPVTGGAAGNGGGVAGGGVWAGNGTVTISASDVNFNHVFAGAGGTGGRGGDAVKKDFALGGNGGAAGDAGPAAGGGVYVVTGSVTLAKNSQVNGTSGATAVLGGRGGKGGSGGTDHNFIGATGIGGAAGTGGSAGGGGIWIQDGNVTIPSGSTIEFNVVVGGTGGAGGSGNTGGVAAVAGLAQGGGIYALDGTVDISGLVKANSVKGGTGGEGGAGQFGSGGAGAAGGLAQGGGVYAGSGNIDLINQAKIENNTASGGAGGKGGDGRFGGTGGVGGTAGIVQGGGIYAGSGAVDITSSLVSKNLAAGNSGGVGGAGGVGGNGGNGAFAEGGGIYIGTGSLSLNQANINANKAAGLLGGGAGGGIFTSGEGGLGGTGANAEGGGIFISGGAISFNMTQSSVTSNSAGPGGDGGTGGGSTGQAGASGDSFGGGIYVGGGTTLIKDSTIGLNNANPGGDLATSASSTPGISQGGGMYIASTVTSASIYNSTIARNTSDDEGGGILNAGTLTITSTIVADNVSGTTTITDLDDTGTASTLIDSLIQNPAGNSAATTAGNFSGEPDSLVNLSTTLTAAANGTNYFTFTGNTSDAFKNGSNPLSLTLDQIDHLRVFNGETDIGAIQTGSTVTAVPFIAAAGKNGYVEVIELVNPTTQKVIQNFQPFPGFTGLVSVTLGDVNGDGIPDIITAAAGQIKVYDGYSAIVPGVSFSASSTWTRLVAVNGRTTPVLYQFIPIPGYAGNLNLAAGDLLGNGVEDIIAATGAGYEGEVVVYSWATKARVALLVPFGLFTGGIEVTAGDMTGNGSDDVIVGTFSKTDQVKIYSLQGNSLVQQGNTIVYKGAFTATSLMEITAIDVNGNGIDDVAMGVLTGGIGTVQIVNNSGAIQKTIPVGSGLTSMAISVYNPAGEGADSLLVGTIPGGATQFLIIDPSKGTEIGGFNEFPALVGAIQVAGS
jgi:hypothetical protein